MREREPFQLYSSDRVHTILANNSIFNVLASDCVKRNIFTLSLPFEAADAQGTSLGLEIEPFAVLGKVALFLEDKTQGEDFGTREGDTIGLRIKDLKKGAVFYYIPGCAGLPDNLRQRLDGADLVFFDGTLFRDDEMVTAGVGHKTGRRMGHMSMSGESGSLAAFRDVAIKRKVYIHINNTNPVLIEDSPERKIVESERWQVAYDGQVIEL